MFEIVQPRHENEELFEAHDGTVRVYVDAALNRPEALGGIEDYRPGEPEGTWTYFYAQVWFVLSGEVECTYGLPPHYEEEVVRIKAGDMVYIPVGMEARFRVLGDQPFRKVFVSMPRPKNLGFD